MRLEAQQQRREGPVVYADGDVDIHYGDIRLRAARFGIEQCRRLAERGRLGKADIARNLRVEHAFREELVHFIEHFSARYGKVKLLLQKNIYIIESAHDEILETLLQDGVIATAYQPTTIVGLPPPEWAVLVDDLAACVGAAPFTGIG